MWEPRLIMVNGELIPFADARVHPLSLAVAYASTVFEGLRAYRHPGTGEYTIFRLAEHIRRLQVGMKVMRFDARYEVEEMRAHLSRLIRANHPDDDVYVRLLVYVEAIGLMAHDRSGGLHRRGDATRTAQIRRHRHEPGREQLESAVGQRQPPAHQGHRQLSQRPPHPAAGQIRRLRRRADAHSSWQGVRGADRLLLHGARRTADHTLGDQQHPRERHPRHRAHACTAKCTGREVQQRDVDRSELYFADEAFLCGTGQEILPVVTAIDRLPVGDGRPGVLTTSLRERYFAVVRGLVPDHPEWRAPV
jgi:branched-chain amino acid aminotransferase